MCMDKQYDVVHPASSRIESPRRPRPHFPTRTNLPPTTPPRARSTHARTHATSRRYSSFSIASIDHFTGARATSRFSFDDDDDRSRGCRARNQGHARRRRDDAREEPRGFARDSARPGGAGKYRRVDTERTMD